MSGDDDPTSAPEVAGESRTNSSGLGSERGIPRVARHANPAGDARCLATVRELWVSDDRGLRDSRSLAHFVPSLFSMLVSV